MAKRLGMASKEVPNGEYTLKLWADPAAEVQVAPDVDLTVPPGETVSHTFDVSALAGVLTGTITVNGQPPPASQYRVCATTQGVACHDDIGADGVFRLLMLPGPGTGEVRDYSGNVLASFTFTVTAGQTTDVDDPVANAAPTVGTISGPSQANEGETATYSVTATDPHNDTLTYPWSWRAATAPSQVPRRARPQPWPSPTVPPRSTCASW